jgi:hypothetical protein
MATALEDPDQRHVDPPLTTEDLGYSRASVICATG